MIIKFFWQLFFFLDTYCTHTLSLDLDVMKFLLLCGFNFINNVSKKSKAL